MREKLKIENSLQKLIRQKAPEITKKEIVEKIFTLKPNNKIAVDEILLGVFEIYEKIKTVIVASPGNSGAGAIHDYLLSRKDFLSPFFSQEFRFKNDPQGLYSLYHNLYKNFNVNNAAFF